MAHMVTDQNHVSALRWYGMQGSGTEFVGLVPDLWIGVWIGNSASPCSRQILLSCCILCARTQRERERERERDIYIYTYMYSKIRPNGPWHEQGAIVFC